MTLTLTPNVQGSLTLGSFASGSHVISPLSYGAVGDGVTDDTDAIQESVDDLEAGEILDFAGKTYLVSDDIALSTANVLLWNGKLLGGAHPVLTVTGADVRAYGMRFERSTTGAVTVASPERSLVVVNAARFLSLDCDYLNASLACLYLTAGACTGAQIIGGRIRNSSAKQNACAVYAAAGAYNDEIVVDRVQVEGTGCPEGILLFDARKSIVRGCRVTGMAELATSTWTSGWTQVGVTDVWYRTDRTDGVTRVLFDNAITAGGQQTENTATPTTPGTDEFGCSGGTLYLNLGAGVNPNTRTISSKITSGYGITIYASTDSFIMSDNLIEGCMVWDVDGFGIYLQLPATGAGNQVRGVRLRDVCTSGIQNFSLPFAGIGIAKGIDTLLDDFVVTTTGGASALASPGVHLSVSGSGIASNGVVRGAADRGFYAQTGEWRVRNCRAYACGSKGFEGASTVVFENCEADNALIANRVTGGHQVGFVGTSTPEDRVFSVKEFGATGDGATNDRPSCQLAIDACEAAGGGIVEFPAGTYYLNSVDSLLVPRTVGMTFRGSGIGRTTIKLSSNSPSFLRFNKISGGDTFKNITVEDFSVDANNIQGNAHTIIGNYTPLGVTSSISFENIVVRRVRAYNIPTDNADPFNDYVRIGIYLGLETAGSCTRVLIEDVRIEGGQSGIIIASSHANLWFDEIVLNRCYHDALPDGSVPSAPWAWSNFHLGSLGYGGSAKIIDCFGRASADVGVEINSFHSWEIRNTTIRDCAQWSFYHRQFHAPIYGAQAQEGGFYDCRAESIVLAVDDQDNATGNALFPGRAFGITNDTGDSSGLQIGHVTVEGCSVYRKNPVGLSGTSTPGAGICILNGEPVHSLTVRNFSFKALTIATNDATTAVYQPIYCHLGGTRSSLRLENVRLVVDGDRPTAGVTSFTGVWISGGSLAFECRNIEIDLSITGGTAGTFRGVYVGDSTAANVTGTINGLRLRRAVASATEYGVEVASTTTLTIPAPGIRVWNSDLAAAATDDVKVGTGQTLVYLDGAAA